MNIGYNIAELRKQKGFSRDDLAKIVGTSGAVIGRYEREEITPSVEIAKKMADALDVSLDYLTGSTSLNLNKKMAYRLELLERLEKNDKERILYVMDSLLRDAQLTETHKKLA